ncbi:hypothetical protein TanjilG_30465 [Lupinus angustifolius]|uniref:golgin IMH1-like n=1 Tax=Lupinus angustifolius TaxID=3871 RepID=UPI00090D60EE|nr:PREDICTED: golgin IMH1-like [Lupinus angustifolius]XP_019429105.1 PREDICTED: golgin IMH1-like [Lupinus angustifolius]XP_019429106.1 PREDICTED: golgin IMH1-like [Lupinus angustifolius]OIV91243.1 hypothetical protein TanjilG_30465 [Lupinus angustifolius]
MKKLFFFKSSASSSGSNHETPPKSTEKQVVWENLPDDGMNNEAHAKAEDYIQSHEDLFSKSLKQVPDSPRSSRHPVFTWSRSLSSPLPSDPHHKFEHSSHCQVLNSGKQKQDKPTQLAVPSIQNSNGHERPGSTSSSTCSSNTSRKTVDCYIDGEQQPEGSRLRNNSHRYNTRHGSYGMKLPPKIQHTAPNSPTGGVKDKRRAHSFREAKVNRHHFSSLDWTENGFGHESPRSLAKNVIERLSQSHDLDNPITIEDIYARSVNEHDGSNLDDSLSKSCVSNEPYIMKNDYHDNSEGFGCEEPKQDVDAELMRKSKEAEERVIVLSKKFERENFFPDGFYDMPTLIQTIRNLAEEKISLAVEVSTNLRSHVADRISAREELRHVKAEQEFRTRRLENEKNEMQSALEKELDRRSSDWSTKLEKYQLEEQRLRERVRELAEQNVSLQREVSSLSEREMESKSVVTYTDQQLKELTERTEGMKEEILDLRQNLLELQEKYKITEENRDCIRRSFDEKDKECKELHKSLTRLLRTCSEQEKTITGLQDGFSEDFQKNQSSEMIDKHVAKMHMEQMRLTGVELGLRKELESCKFEADSLRHENIILLNRLKVDGKECIPATFKLDKELWARVCCLQNQGLMMLNESTYLCSDLLEFIKRKGGHLHQNIQLDIKFIENGLDGQFIIESETKIHGLKSGTEGLTRSLQMMSSLLKDKSSPLTSKFQPEFIDGDNLAKLNDQSSEDIIRTELKAECLVTSLFREKLYSKELEVEQMQAELATAVRGNDILRSEVQNTLDNLSSVKHKLKDLELQMLKKDDTINCLQSNLQEAVSELNMMRGILPQVSEEKDLMWEKVKEYNEQNMLLKSELTELKKKIETLDEDILVKEGQITILKDSLDIKPFDLLGNPDSMHGFLLS